MYYPNLRYPTTYRETVDTFGGYRKGLKIGPGEFADMLNLTSDHYPVLGPRAKRGTFASRTSAQGLIARDTLCYVDGSRFVMDGYPVEMGLSAEGPKQLVSMGSYVIIFPDKKYINTADITDTGYLEAEFSCRGATLSPCDGEGNPVEIHYRQGEAPAEPLNKEYWLDNSGTKSTLRQWSAASEMWVELDSVYVRIAAPGIGSAFRAMDGVTLSGFPADAGLNGSNVIWALGEDYIAVAGLADGNLIVAGTICVERKLPRMDFVIECGNRLWGCRYGMDAGGRPVNEIYASKLGDFRNWSCYLGTAADSYAVSLGSDGAFTGAISHMGYPLFFREGCMHKIYGSYPSNFRLQTTPCRGVQRGSHKSLAIVGDVLYYKSPTGVCAFDGSLPVEVSAELGLQTYTDGVAAAWGSKYYIGMTLKDTGERSLFVYDTARRLWHRENDPGISEMCCCRNVLYGLAPADGKIYTLAGDIGTETNINWMAQTGLIGGNTPDAKYLAGLLVRMSLSPGAQVHFYLRYDSTGPWECAGDVSSGGLNSFSVPIRPRRCDHLELRMEGQGEARIYSLTRSMERGSDYF